MDDSPPGAKSGGDEDSESSNDGKLAQFMDLTNAAEDVAKYWLEASAYSVENAVNMFMESGGVAAGSARQAGPRASEGFMEGGASGTSMSSRARGASSAGGEDLTEDLTAGASAQGSRPDPHDPDYVRPADPIKRQRLVDDVRSHGYGGMSTMRPWGPTLAANPFRDFSQESRQAARGYATRPGEGSSNSAAAEKERKLANIFSPPTDIMFMGDFQTARQTAKQDKKWLLVNIQSDVEFDCHKLNRDVWKDEMVQNIIACTCIFWQQPSVSEEAKTFCRRYNVTGYPHIAIIDPRTGMKVWSHQGFLEPTEFVEKVTDVTDKISLEDGAPPRLPPPPKPPKLPPNTSGSEDQMLAAAIAASLEGNVKEQDGESGERGTAASNGHRDNPLPVELGSSLPRTDGEGPSTSARPSRAGSPGVPDPSVRRNASRGEGSAASPASVDGDDDDDEDEEDYVEGDDVEDGDADGDDDNEDDEEEEEEEEEEDMEDEVEIIDASAVASGGRVRGRSSVSRPGGTHKNGNLRGTGPVAGEVVDVSGDDTVNAPGEAENGSTFSPGGSSFAAVAPAANSVAGRTPDRALDVEEEEMSKKKEEKQEQEEGKEEEEEEADGEEKEALEESPEESSPDKTSVRFQFPTGQRVLRRFRKTSKVRQLYLFVASELDEAKTRPFDIRTVRPPASIRHAEEDSIEDAGLSNSAVVVAWQD